MSSWTVSESTAYAGFHDYVKPEFRAELSRPLAVALIDPNAESRDSAIDALKSLNLGMVRSFIAYPLTAEHSFSVATQGFDVILIGVNDDLQNAFAALEALCVSTDATIMAYTRRSNEDLVMRAMRAGARELLAFPFRPGVLEEAFDRAAARIRAPATPPQSGRLYVFCGAKGGSGVTTVAVNFAVSIAQESKKPTLLIDLDVPLGDAALDLGIRSRYSTLDALMNAPTLDAAFLAGLLTEHSSGLWVLPSPGTQSPVDCPRGAVEKLLDVARQGFENVIVDAGSHWSWTDAALLEDSTAIYLVSQVGIPELRNCNRVITTCFEEHGGKLEIVLNRYAPGMFGLDDQHIEGALTRPAQWRIPSDYVSVRRMQNEASPLVLGNSEIAQIVRTMARTASGSSEEPRPKKRSGWFGWVAQWLGTPVYDPDQRARAHRAARSGQVSSPFARRVTPSRAFPRQQAVAPGIAAPDGQTECLRSRFLLHWWR